MIRNEQVVLNLKVSKDFAIEQINFVETQWLRFDLYIGQHISKLLGDEQANELIKHLKHDSPQERIIIQHQHQRYWLQTSPIDDGYLFEFFIYNPFEVFSLSNKFSFELLELCEDGIILTNSFGQIIYANDAFCKFSKYTAENLTGKMFYPIFINSENYSTCINKDVYNDKMVCLDGTVVPVKIRPQKIQITENEHIIAYIVKDLTNIQKAENEIWLREQLLDSIFFSSQQFLFSKNWTENILNVLEHLGLAIKASTIKLYENFIDDHEQLHMKPHAEWKNPAFKHHTSSKIASIPYFPLYEHLFCTLSGGDVYFIENEEFRQIISADSAILVPVFVATQWWGFLSVEIPQPLKIWKTTEIQALKQIAAIVGAAIFQNRIINEQWHLKEKAEQSNRIKTAFLSNIGHELRTPLNSIIGFSDLLLKVTPPNEKIYEYAQHIQENSFRLLKTIDHLVEFAKLESKSSSVNITSFNIHLFLTEMAFFTQQEIIKQNKKIQVNLNCNNQHWEITTDRKKLKQIYEHLIDNAIKYTYSGLIEIGCIAKDDFYEFYILDTGIGIEPEQQQIIFKSFSQLNVEPSRTKSGLGIGLTITAKLVTLLQGKIMLQSTPNKGTVFFVQLPQTFTSKTHEKSDISENDETETVYVYDNDDELFTKLYSILRQQYPKIKRVRQFSEIQSDASYVIVNMNHPNKNLQKELNTIAQKFPSAKVVTHQYKNTTTLIHKIAQANNEDQLYWNILSKIKMSTIKKT